MPKLSIIIPCYYNAANIPITSKELFENEKNFPEEVSFEYIFIDDASKDNTYQVLIDLYNQFSNKVKIIKLVGNVGSYNAVVAGMEYATGDFTVIIAADLQDPPEMMVEMYKYWKQGFKLVIGNRNDRKDSINQKIFANSFHFLMRKLALKRIPKGGFDYVLFDKQIREKLVEIKEPNSNIFYLMIWMGYNYVNIPYVRKKREIGKSKWTLQKKVKLLIDSFSAFSFFPIRAITVMGLILGVVALLYAIFIIIARIMGLINIQGWTALMIVLLFVSSFNMFALGIIGEYVWRNLDAARKRPIYMIDEVHEIK